jgi:hypothetical protein
MGATHASRGWPRGPPRIVSAVVRLRAADLRRPPGGASLSDALSLVKEIGDAGRDHPHEVSLRLGEQWVPDVEDQHDTLLVAVVPGFVLDGVIKHQCGAGMPLAQLRADPEAAVRWDDQGNVFDEPVWAGMRVFGSNREKNEVGPRFGTSTTGA